MLNDPPSKRLVVFSPVGLAEKTAVFRHQKSVIGVVANGNVCLVGDVIVEPVAVSCSRTVKSEAFKVAHIPLHRIVMLSYYVNVSIHQI